MIGFPSTEGDPELIEAEESVPDGFWDMPSTFIERPEIQTMYKSLYKQLLKENPDKDTIEIMMIERAAALYAYMRSLEATEGYRNSSDYRQLTALWNAMANDLRKTRTVNFDEAKIREEISYEYVQLVNTALRGFDPEIANSVRQRILNALSQEK